MFTVRALELNAGRSEDRSEHSHMASLQQQNPTVMTTNLSEDAQFLGHFPRMRLLCTHGSHRIYHCIQHVFMLWCLTISCKMDSSKMPMRPCSQEAHFCADRQTHRHARTGMIKHRHQVHISRFMCMLSAHVDMHVDSERQPRAHSTGISKQHRRDMQ